MEKDYTNWHKLKTALNNNEASSRPYFHDREIWYCSLGDNIGSEQDGKGEEYLRPVIVFKKFNNEIFWAIPLTKSKNKKKEKNQRFYYAFSFMPDITSIAILSQIRLVDGKRLKVHMGVISEENFNELKEKLKALFP